MQGSIFVIGFFNLVTKVFLQNGSNSNFSTIPPHGMVTELSFFSLPVEPIICNKFCKGSCSRYSIFNFQKDRVKGVAKANIIFRWT